MAGGDHGGGDDGGGSGGDRTSAMEQSNAGIAGILTHDAL